MNPNFFVNKADEVNLLRWAALLPTRSKIRRRNTTRTIVVLLTMLIR